MYKINLEWKYGACSSIRLFYFNNYFVYFDAHGNLKDKFNFDALPFSIAANLHEAWVEILKCFWIVFSYKINLCKFFMLPTVWLKSHWQEHCLLYWREYSDLYLFTQT